MTKHKIAIIGAGKLAYSLIPLLKNQVMMFICVISKKLSSSKLLAQKFSIPHHSNSLNKIPDDVDVFFLTVPDGEIKRVANNLSKLKRILESVFAFIFQGWKILMH